jgi:hypothetical protein
MVDHSLGMHVQMIDEGLAARLRPLPRASRLRHNINARTLDNQSSPV